MVDTQTIQKRLVEYMACKRDFNYYCRNYVYIELPGGDVLLNPYNKQLDVIDLIQKSHFVLTLKSRQIGISTIIQAFCSWLTIFYDNVVIGIISKDGKEATDFARAIRGMIEKLPDWMKPKKGVVGLGFAKRTEQSFILTNGSKVYATPVAPNAPEKTLRGKAITFLVIDEAAFIKYIDIAWTAMVPALSTNQMQARKANIPYGTVVLSTPNKTSGVGKWFFDRYSKAVSGSDILKHMKIHWSMIPELASDPYWYKTMCDLFENDQRKIQQELELKFLATTGSFFDETTTEKLQDVDVKPIEILKLFNGEVWKYENPQEGAYYIIGVDTAPEHGLDKSAITIWDYKDLRQVWEYQGKCAVLDFVKIVKVACAQYPGLVVIEKNSYGNQVCESINNSEFAVMMYKEKRGNAISIGLETTSKSRPLMIDALYSYITEFPEMIKSSRLSLELIGLVSKPNGKVEADTGSHDDLALATALCLYVRKYDPPVMIDSASIQTQEFTNILNFNNLSSLSQMTNANVMKHVKDNIEDMQGFVDILSLYGEK